jgi:small-conductance mechanosensitive channel
VIALVTQWLVTRITLIFTRKTKTSLDDAAVRALRWPLFLTILFVGVGLALRNGEPEVSGVPGTDPHRALQDELDRYLHWAAIARSLMLTLGIFFWTRAFMKISDALLEALARRADEFRWIEPRSLPLYEIGSKLLLLGGATYAIMLAWDIDVTAWLASAGVLGIAIGFAAKDTLANLFAGVFILADAPYKLGDFIVLESGERGRVTDIGIRSTRILTRDDIEITLPNGIMANSKIVNESSGPHPKRRLRLDIGIAYGSDVDRAREVMMEAARSSQVLSEQPAPSVRFRSFGDSALLFQVRGFIEQPVLHGRAMDELGIRIYKALLAADIEIPFPQRVVHLPQPAAIPTD